MTTRADRQEDPQDRVNDLVRARPVPAKRLTVPARPDNLGSYDSRRAGIARIGARICEVADRIMEQQPAPGFAGLLRRLRGEAKLTQEELAQAAGISTRSVSDLERGINRTARKDTALLLADALNLAEPARALFVAAARAAQPRKCWRRCKQERHERRPLRRGSTLDPHNPGWYQRSCPSTWPGLPAASVSLSNSKAWPSRGLTAQ